MQAPRQQNLGELADTFERVSNHANDVYQGKNDHADMGQVGAGALAEPGLYPFGAGKYIGTPQPHTDIDHKKYLVKRRPDPWNPYTLEAVDKTQVHQPHGPSDVELTRCVRDAENIPRQGFATEKIGVQILGGSFGDPKAY